MMFSDETKGAYKFDYQRLHDLEAREAKQMSDFDKEYLSVNDLEELEWLRGCMEAAKEKARKRVAEQQEREAFEARSEATKEADPDGDLATALRRLKNSRNREVGRLIREEPVEVRTLGGGIESTGQGSDQPAMSRQPSEAAWKASSEVSDDRCRASQRSPRR